jgi:hypothetical protein
MDVVHIPCNYENPLTPWRQRQLQSTQCIAQKSEHCLKLSVNNMQSKWWPLIPTPSAEYSGYLILAPKG